MIPREIIADRPGPDKPAGFLRSLSAKGPGPAPVAPDAAPCVAPELRIRGGIPPDNMRRCGRGEGGEE